MVGLLSAIHIPERPHGLGVFRGDGQQSGRLDLFPTTLWIPRPTNYQTLRNWLFWCASYPFARRGQALAQISDAHFWDTIGANDEFDKVFEASDWARLGISALLGSNPATLSGCPHSETVAIRMPCLF